MGRHSRFAGLAVVVVAGTATLAADPPASRVNPASGFTEIVNVDSSSSYKQVRHTTDDGSVRPPTVVLTTAQADNLRPRIAVSGGGRTWVVWYRDLAIDQVIAMSRDATGTWSDERLLSLSTEESRLPFVIHDGADAWVAYEIKDGSDTDIAVSIITDEPDPIATRSVIATSSYQGDFDLEIHHETGHLWVTWTDSTDEVGWSQYDYLQDDWSLPQLESYANDSPQEARERIRTEVLAN